MSQIYHRCYSVVTMQLRNVKCKSFDILAVTKLTKSVVALVLPLVYICISLSWRVEDSIISRSHYLTLSLCGELK